MSYAFLIAAPTSNSGKTTVTLGLMRALMNRGLSVQPFKCGPDYIDPMHHRQVAGRDSYNLDTWMSAEAHVSDLFARQRRTADVAIVEGVMGLFDGAVRDEGSPARLAMLLDIPVVLVINGRSMAYSAAPLLYGLKHFDPRVRIAGAIFNMVSGDNHYAFLRDAAQDAGVTSFGYLQRNERLALTSRHLGLSMPHENGMDELVGEMAGMMAQSIDLDALLGAVAAPETAVTMSSPHSPGSLRIAVARDEAFNFMYPANVDALARLGEVTFFSPLADNHLPDADVLWLPGGYPELFADVLSANTTMMQAIRAHVEANKVTIAECGGFMYLSRLLRKDDQTYPMAGIFDVETSFHDARLTLGYRQLNLDGRTFRGHEFHYSTASFGNQRGIAQALTARNQQVEMPVLRYKNCLGSYMHFYCGEPHKMNELLGWLST